MKLRFWQRLSGQVIILLGVLVTTLLLSGGGLLMALGYQSDRDTAIKIQKEVACRAASDISGYVSERIHVLELTAKMAASEPDTLPGVMDNLLLTYPELMEILAVNGEGDIQARATQGEALLGNPFSIQQSLWFDTTQTGENYLSGVFLSDTDRPYIILSVPISGDDHADGAVAARLDMQALREIAAQIDVGSGGQAYFVNSTQVIIGHPDPEIVMEQRPQPDNLAYEGGVYNSIDGVSVVGATCEIDRTDWLAVAEMPAGEAFYRASAERGRVGTFFLVLMLSLTTLIGWWLARHIVQPVRQLMTGVQHITAGDYEYRLNMRRKDEFGELAQAVDEMSSELRQHNQAIMDLNQNLEARVEQRTHQLKEAYRRMSESNRRMEAIAEALYQVSEEANAASKAKTQFLANISHELRTPLNSMIMYHDLMLRGAYGELTNKQRKRLTNSRESARSLGQLINDILDLAKIEAGEMTIQRKPVDINQILTHTEDVITPLLKSDKVSYQLALLSELPFVKGDSQRIQQVILNLTSNAAKFTKEGYITLWAWALIIENGEVVTGKLPPGIAVGSIKSGNWVVVMVEDTGIGIPPEMHHYIFDDFKQVDDGNTREYGGTGLGLSICKKLITALNGHIGLDSKPDEGSRFWFILPAYALPQNIDVEHDTIF